MQLTNDQIKIKDLLYMQKTTNEIINTEIEEIMRGRGRSTEDIKEEIFYNLNERFAYLEKMEQDL